MAEVRTEFNVLQQNEDQTPSKKYLYPDLTDPQMNYDEALGILNEIKIKEVVNNKETILPFIYHPKHGEPPVEYYHGVYDSSTEVIKIETSNYGNLLAFILKILIPDTQNPQISTQPNEQQNKIIMIRKAIIIKFAQIVKKPDANSNIKIDFKYLDTVSHRLTLLLDADLKLKQSIKDLKDARMGEEELVKQLDRLLIRLGYLQGLILLGNINKPTQAPRTPADLFTPIITALNDKLDAVNGMLENSLGIDVKSTQNKYNNSITPYYNKYLKYKNKYLELKKI